MVLSWKGEMKQNGNKKAAVVEGHVEPAAAAEEKQRQQRQQQQPPPQRRWPYYRGNVTCFSLTR